MAGSWRSAPEREPFLLRYGACCITATGVAASRAAAFRSVRAITSALGPRRPDHALEPGPALSPPPPRGSRRGLSDGATARRRTEIPAPGRPATARSPVAVKRAGRSHPRSASAARGAGAADPRADGDAGWLGEGLDVGWAIDVLQPLAAWT